MSSTPLPQAALWDFDGTLVDTAEMWLGAERALVAALGGPTWTRQMSAHVHGFAMVDGAAACIEHAGKTGQVDPVWGVELMERHALNVLKDTEVEWRPGALELVADIAKHGIPQSIVSMSSEPILRAAMTNLNPTPFDDVVAGDHVSYGKPHPEPYLTAARRLNVTAESSVAFEDSTEGRTSAEAAGCFVVAIHFHHAHESAPGRMPVSTLEALPWERVVAEYGRWAASR